MAVPLYELLGKLKTKSSLTADEVRLMALLDVAQARTLAIDISRLADVSGASDGKKVAPSQVPYSSPQASPTAQSPSAPMSSRSFAKPPGQGARPGALSSPTNRPATVSSGAQRPASPSKAARTGSPMRGGPGIPEPIPAMLYDERRANKQNWGNGPPTPAGSDVVPKWKIESERMRRADAPRSPPVPQRPQSRGAKHRALRNYDKQYEEAKKTGGPLPPPMEAEEDPTYVQCPNCGRKFNETAGARHIPKCSSIQAKPTRLVKGSGHAGGAI